MAAGEFHHIGWVGMGLLNPMKRGLGGRKGCLPVLRHGLIVALMALGLPLLFPISSLGMTHPAIPEPVSGRAASPEGILPADVLARVELLRKEVGAIRFEMGKPRRSSPPRAASRATSHEVYFQAITLFLKADRLALELAGSTGVLPEGVSPLGIRPYHVWTIVNAAYLQIQSVKQELGIQESFAEQPQDPSTTPTDVVRAIVRTNRQLNLMLERRFSPSDVYQQITVAIEYTSHLLELFPGENQAPSAPRFQRGKVPRDVFVRLLDCYSRLRSIAHRSGVTIGQLDAKAVKGMEVRPSDVYDLATLIVSDLAYLHAHFPKMAHPRIVTHPGRKFPSHVYQQAGVLQTQLIALDKHVADNSGWLQPSAR